MSKIEGSERFNRIEKFLVEFSFAENLPRYLSMQYSQTKKNSHIDKLMYTSGKKIQFAFGFFFTRTEENSSMDLKNPDIG